MFRRIYASFGSSAPYKVFEDSQPFLKWVRDQGLMVGIVSNAEYRYRDVILPALGLNRVRTLFFSSFVYFTSRIWYYNGWIINASLSETLSTLENSFQVVFKYL